MHFRAFSITVCSFLGVSTCASSFAQTYLQNEPSMPNEFDWSSVAPSNDLVYHSCFAIFECARLLVPLDWQADQNPKLENTIAIAIIKLPAVVAPTDHKYAGPIVTNPGGPGASGIDFLQASGQFLQSVVDSDSAHFDIISFDPRGVGVSEPSSNCFSDSLERATWYLKFQVSNTLSSNESDIRVPWARARALGRYCSRERVGEYLSSASVARDLLHIIEKDKSLQNGQRAKLLTQKQQGTEGQGTHGGLQVNDDGGDAMLQYIGFSYGTFLGATFASMFPNRVKSMVMDGVFNAESWVSDGGHSNLHDTDEVLQEFYRDCYEAGSKCPLHQTDGPDRIQQGVENLLFRLEQEPMIAIDETGRLPPEIVTSRDVKSWIFSSLYNPRVTFPLLASLLSDLLQGKTEQFLPLLLAQKSIRCPSANDPPRPPTQNEAQQAIVCADSTDRTNQTISQFQSYISRLETQSSLAGALLAGLTLPCTEWTARPKWRFEGPFVSRSTQSILWMGNGLDPITPIGNAYYMAEQFSGSVVLEQDGVGHCALFNGPSECTFEVVREHFAAGKLPERRMKCPGARRMFDEEEVRVGRGEEYGYARLVRPFWLAGGPI